MIERRNILDLIGKHRGKYHSCVITCYSLDFSFFEERVLPTLRLANIKNVNVLADGHYLEMAQEATIGKEFRHNKTFTYNFQPIYEQGVFHPKILLLTGMKHGLLIIGSGNITSSGLNTNDEIWGAFHLDNIGNENAPLFGAVWKYLQPLLNKSLGFIPQKIDWIRKQSPWLNELPIADDWINLVSLDLRVRFMSNTGSSSLYLQLVSSIPSREVEELTVISPYYDRNGRLISLLKDTYKPDFMRCLVDPNSGLLPLDLEQTVADQISFHSWSDCKKDYDEKYNRLHAKIFHFKTRDNQEYMFLGSANATTAAMGSNSAPAANAEAGMLIHRSGAEKTWLQELKVQIPETTVELNSNSTAFGLGDSSVQRVNYCYRVFYSELRANEITIHLNKTCGGNVTVSIQDRNGLQISCRIKEISGNILIVETAEPGNIFKLMLEDENGARVSNYSIIHRLEALLRCNPDPNEEKLDVMLEQDFTDGEGMTDLLQFVDYNWADDEGYTAKKVFNSGVSGVRKAPESDQTKEYQVLNADEFNKVSSEILLKQSGELSNSTVKIAEFLHLYTLGVFGKEEDFNESEEQKLFEDEEQKGEGEEAENKSRKRTQGSKEKAALSKYFKKLNEIYTARLSQLFTTQALTEVPQTPITIRSLSSILIALHLIQLKYGKKFTTIIKELNEQGDPITKEEAYINVGRMDDSVETLKGFLINVLGKFLLLSAAGSKNYDFELLNQKLLESQMQLLMKSVYLILNTPWRDQERAVRDVLLLNCMYFSIGERILSDEVCTEVVQKLTDCRNSSTYIIPEFQGQLTQFATELLPSYKVWLSKYMDELGARKELISPTTNLSNGNIIFSSKIGFNIVRGGFQENGKCKLNLYRAGYPYVNNEFALKNIQFGSKSIKFQWLEIFN